MVKIIRCNPFKLIIASAVLCCFISCMFIINTIVVFASYSRKNIHKDISCYYKWDNVLSVNDKGFSQWLKPLEKSIYFHETSTSGGLSCRQACAVEAAARAHKDWDIYVLFLAPINCALSKSFDALQKFERVKFSQVNILQYANNTPLYNLVASGALNRTSYRLSHTSDALRYLTMYKWGGIYLDLDTVVVKPLDELGKNWSARESDELIAAGAMAFSRDRVGRMFADAAIRNLAKNYQGDNWANNGPGVITRVLEEKCSTSDVAHMSAKTCQGFEVYDPKLFYPIVWQEAFKYFEPGEISQTPYVYHVWNYITGGIKYVRKGSIYAKLARKHCPSVFQTFCEDFGDCNDLHTGIF